MTRSNSTCDGCLLVKNERVRELGSVGQKWPKMIRKSSKSLEKER